MARKIKLTQEHIDRIEFETATTPDEVGALFRVHMLSENILEQFLDSRLSTDSEPAARMPDTFSKKLKASADNGLPPCAADVFKHINRMRNIMAHEQETETRVEDIAELHRLVDGTSAINPQFTPLNQRRSHISAERREGKDPKEFKNYDLATPFFIFVGELARWEQSAMTRAC